MKFNFDNIWIIGGESIYKYFITNNLVNEIFATEINNDFNCDTFFPSLDDNVWEKSLYKKVKRNNRDQSYSMMKAAYQKTYTDFQRQQTDKIVF